MMRVLLIGDQSSGLDRLRAWLARERDFVVVGEATLPELARALLATDAYEGVFFDAGARIAETDVVQAVRPAACIVYVDAATQPCLRAGLVVDMAQRQRPAVFENLEDVLEQIARKNLTASTEADAHALVPVKIGAITRLLPVSEIRLIVARENYTHVMLQSGERVFVRRTLRHWQEMLSNGNFARVHRGLILNLAHVGRVECRAREHVRLHFTTGSTPPVAVKRRHWPALRARIDLYQMAHRRVVDPLPNQRATG